MSGRAPDAGELLERVRILRLVEDGGAFAWEVLRTSWAAAELTGRRSNYSVHGVGAAGVSFIIRRQDISLVDAIEWRGHHCFVTNISDLGRLHLTVEAAQVQEVDCEYAPAGLTFPGVLTEKYLGHDQLDPMAINTMRYVLVTDKGVDMKPGKLVRVAGVDWPITVAHTLDPWHNEYELERTVDL
jgi:hypothetical protein